MKKIEAIIRRKTKFEGGEGSLPSSDIDLVEYHNVHGIGQVAKSVFTAVYNILQMSSSVYR